MSFGIILLAVVCGIAAIFIAYTMIMIWKDNKKKRVPDQRMFCCNTCVSEYVVDVSIGDKCPRCDTGVYEELSEW